ncbi:MAG: Nif3-like dinuclear metal center hexameric protein [Sporolactobacillus sp.]
MADWITGQRLINKFEEWARPQFAFEKDRIGLLIGSLDKPVRRVMVTLDVLENVAEEAANKHVDLIVAHHPVIFHPLAQVLTDRGQGKIISQCLKHDIAVYAAHTNLDVAEGGVNDLLAERLGLRETDILQETGCEPLYKIVIHAPDAHAESIRRVLAECGVASNGHNHFCTSSSPGISACFSKQVIYSDISRSGILEHTDNVRIEGTVTECLLEATMARVRTVCPCEQPVYELYRLPDAGKSYGLGRLGKLAEPMPFGDYCRFVKERFGLSGLRVTGNLKEQVETVAICGGDGNSLIPFARERGADVLISGDIYYHTAHDALLCGLKVIDAGHHIEAIMKQAVCRFLQHVITEQGCKTEVIVSEAPTDPFQFIC